MKRPNCANAAPLCPSAEPHMEGAVIVGIVGGTVDEPRVGYLDTPQPVTDELLSRAEKFRPTEIFRFAAKCAGDSCVHFDGTNCQLASRIVEFVPTVVDILPACQIRSGCRWWLQEGKEACLRCPQVVTRSHEASDALRLAATPKLNGG
jgi:hypothetical protein